MKNIFGTDQKQTQIANPIEEGDAVLIIKKDGSITPMTFGVDTGKAQEASQKDERDLTQDEIDILYQGQVLFLLSMAAKSEVIMQFLGQVSQTAGADDLEKLKKSAMMN